MEILTLDKLKLKDSAFVNEITDDRIKCRLLELGFVKGTIITPVFSSPFSDPVAYKINNMLIALRTEEAKYVNVTLI